MKSCGSVPLVYQSRCLSRRDETTAHSLKSLASSFYIDGAVRSHRPSHWNSPTTLQYCECGDEASGSSESPSMWSSSSSSLALNLLCNQSCQNPEVPEEKQPCPRRCVFHVMIFEGCELWVWLWLRLRFQWPVSLVRKTKHNFWITSCTWSSTPKIIKSSTYTTMMTLKTLWRYTFPSDLSRLNPSFWSFFAKVCLLPFSSSSSKSVYRSLKSPYTCLKYAVFFRRPHDDRLIV